MVRGRSSSATLEITSDTLTPGIRQFPDEIDRGLSQVIDFFTPRVEAYARDNAPWTDRTTNARNGLRATPEHEFGSRHAIVLSHSVPYGIWLEVRFAGRYAIIDPTVAAQGPELMSTVRGLFGKI